ncbi:hypothetical protein N0V90_010614 [Kalmusia sp. IMI 367209]|nr:hypothetical protein N0V90_010614 [Kalmusia sp. IMI 367209]
MQREQTAMAKDTVSFDSESDATGGHEENPLGQPTAPQLRRQNVLTHARLDTTLLGDLTAAANEPYRDDGNDDEMSIDTPDGSIESERDFQYDSKRPYTSQLGVPEQWDQVLPTGLSIISDAGDQQHQEQVVVPGTDACPVNSDDGDSPDFFPSYATDHELMTSIFDAMETRNGENTPDHDLGFLPKRQLYRVINHDNVKRELSKKLLSTGSVTPEKIRDIADTVCTRVPVQHRGKPKFKSFRKIFALLVLLEISESIPLFLAEDVSDLDLPLVNVGKSRWAVDLRRKDTEGNPTKEPLKCFKHPKWSPFKLLNFEKYQWALLAPFFSQGKRGGVHHYLLQKQHVLPFVAPDVGEEEEAEYHGGFAKVFTVRIHKDHHNFTDKKLCDRGFAIKQPYESDRRMFEKEVDILKKFSGERSHEHIVELLATYEQSNKFHFIFYRAEGDLFQYWKSMQWSHRLTPKDISWVAKQCAGLAEGLLRLHRHLTFRTRSRSREDEDVVQKVTKGKHVKIVTPAPKFYRVRSDSMQSNGVQVRLDSPITRPDLPHRTLSSEVIQEERYGRHGDINPGNILWYAENGDNSSALGGTLKIADFGQAELNSLLSRTKQRDVANTLTYRPPECDLQQPAMINQSYDIWCLGCVYLEFITWALGGAKLLEIFSEKRRAPDPFLHNLGTDTFFQVIRNPDTNQPEVMIKKSVTHVSNITRASQHELKFLTMSNQFISHLHQLPNCTEYFHKVLDMVQNNMLLVDSHQRKSCEYIWRTLHDLHHSCEKDADFATRANPWCPNPKWSYEPIPQSYEVDMTEEAEQVIDENLPLHPLQPPPRQKRR